jgi:hypothetical protein
MDYARCPFEKAILSAQHDCELAERFLVGEQLGVGCRRDIARNNCSVLLALMRERARFALKLSGTGAGLPFGKERKIMLGGLLGLQQALAADGSQVRQVRNIHALVQQAQDRYGSLEALPYQEMVRAIVAYRNRRRGSPPAAR